MELLIDNINNYDDNDYNTFLNLIEKDKKEHINKIRNIKNKKQSILGEYLLIKLLKDYKNINYNNLEFYTNINGKRYIKNKRIYFNISHKNNYVVAVISNKEIGIDIEEIKELKANIIKQFATLNEEKEILKDKNKINEKIIELYTLKEAYIKMLGNNLSTIKEIEFNINKTITSNNNINIIVNKSINNYIISICEKK